MNDVTRSNATPHDTCDLLLRHLDDPGGVDALLRQLGFTRALRRIGRARTPSVVRTVATARHGTLTAFVAVLRCELDAARVRETVRGLRKGDFVRHHFVVIADSTWSHVAFAYDAPSTPARCIIIDRNDLRAADVDLIADMLPPSAETPTAVALRIARALDRSRVGNRFFRDVVAIRDLVARSWTGVPKTAAAERDGLALLLLSRLMFLYFLQQRGLLAGRRDYLPGLVAEWRRTRNKSSFYRSRLRPLFFGVLNRQPAQRDARARAMGPLPYLNGGLFEMHALENGRASLDLPDDVVVHVFGSLLEKYRFTSSDADAQADHAGLDVNPEMLGRIFEGLMPGDRRGRTGTFYTPAALVDRVVRSALANHLARHCDVPAEVVDSLLVPHAQVDAPAAVREQLSEALRDLRILDPACGSGAFLLGALAHVAALRRRVDDDAPVESDIRQQVVARSLHGVDLLEDAALICCLRLWLALVPRRGDAQDVPPLPNLDRRVRQGDALIDPLDIGDAIAGRTLDTTAPPELRSLTARLEPLARQYIAADPLSRPALRRQLRSLESALARAWLGALEGRLRWEARELAARSADEDLFGQPLSHAAAAQRRLHTLRRHEEEMASFRRDVSGARRLPFFSFRVHFAEARDGFDLILSNPPWVRAHRWPPGVRDLLRERYRVCESAGWPYAARLVRQPAAAGTQVDLALLFLERSIRLLRENGTLALLLPSKLFRSLYAAGGREMLTQAMRISRVEDHSLDHRGVFDADAFTAVLLANRPGMARNERNDPAEREDPAERSDCSDDVHITLSRAGVEPLVFHVRQRDLPLREGDARAPWLLAPPGCSAALRAMQRAGVPAGKDLVIRRGAMTGANDVLVLREVEPKLGDIARIRTDGYNRAVEAGARRAFSGWVEASTIRPALRGTDVGAWHARPERHVLWAPCNDHPAAPAPPRLHRFLQRHRTALRQPPAKLGMLHRLSAHTLGHKVVWSDLAADLRAAAVPPRVRCVTGVEVPLVPLNTVYFMATSSMRESLLLSAYLNSLPLRVFARAIAERAKDAHFRFFAWTIAVLPLPHDWRSNRVAERLLLLASAAHDARCIEPAARNELDRLVATSFNLDNDDLTHLAAFDAWLAGTTPEVRR
jgi:hypothetical protein